MKVSLRAVDLEKFYGSRKVVDRVSLEIGQGEVVGLLGPNGAGKTTVFSLILGMVARDGGRVYLRGEDITDCPMYLRARKGLCLLPQEPSVFRKLTVEENLRAVLETRPRSARSRSTVLEETLVEFGLDKVARSRAMNLSGGERRRLEIARALMTAPEFMLLDEPFTGIDPLAIVDIQQIIRALRQRGIGILLTDHAVRETLAITDRAYIIDHGRILKEGPPEDLVASDDVRKSYLGEEFRL